MLSDAIEHVCIREHLAPYIERLCSISLVYLTEEHVRPKQPAGPSIKTIVSRLGGLLLFMT